MGNVSDHGNASVVRHFKKDFLNIKGIIVREELKKKYEKQIQEANRQNLKSPKSIKKYSLKTVRSLLLGKFD